MRVYFLIAPVMAFIGLCGVTNQSRAQTTSTTQTLVFVRHGEKPEAGLGQLSCKGLNRALALPKVLAQKFGLPDVIFAPNSAHQKKDMGVPYDYVRPLATIEPTAIQFGKPVNTTFGFDDVAALSAWFDHPDLHASTIYVAWEHVVIEAVVKRVIGQAGGDTMQVPTWDGADFDSIYVVRITRSQSGVQATFAIDHEGLNGRAEMCPE